MAAPPRPPTRTLLQRGCTIVVAAVAVEVAAEGVAAVVDLPPDAWPRAQVRCLMYISQRGLPCLLCAGWAL